MKQEEWTPYMNPQTWSDLSSELRKRQILLDFVEDKLRWEKTQLDTSNKEKPTDT